MVKRIKKPMVKAIPNFVAYCLENRFATAVANRTSVVTPRPIGNLFAGNVDVERNFVFLIVPLESQSQNAERLQRETPNHAEGVSFTQQHHVAAAQDDGENLHDRDGVDDAVGGAVLFVRLARFVEKNAVFRYAVHARRLRQSTTCLRLQPE